MCRHFYDTVITHHPLILLLEGPLQVDFVFITLFYCVFFIYFYWAVIRAYFFCWYSNHYSDTTNNSVFMAGQKSVMWLFWTGPKLKWSNNQYKCLICVIFKVYRKPRQRINDLFPIPNSISCTERTRVISKTTIPLKQ